MTLSPATTVAGGGSANDWCARSVGPRGVIACVLDDVRRPEAPGAAAEQGVAVSRSKSLPVLPPVTNSVGVSPDACESARPQPMW